MAVAVRAEGHYVGRLGHLAVLGAECLAIGLQPLNTGCSPCSVLGTINFRHLASSGSGMFYIRVCGQVQLISHNSDALWHRVHELRGPVVAAWAVTA
jgi:hypothetical protein